MLFYFYCSLWLNKLGGVAFNKFCFLYFKSEWSTSSKKKKNRTSADKNSKEKEQPSEAPVEEENWDQIANSKLTTNSKTGNIRGRGRGFRGFHSFIIIFNIHYLFLKCFSPCCSALADSIDLIHQNHE